MKRYYANGWLNQVEAMTSTMQEQTIASYHYDAVGNRTFTYDAYGAVLSHTSDTGSVPQPYQYVGRLGYYTHYMQPEFGWLQLGVRFYDPELGRFERRDSDRTVVNRYLYAASNPLELLDPSGNATYRSPRYRIPPSYGSLPQLMLCFRPLSGCYGILGLFGRHAFLVIGRVPIGYGPGGVGQIDTDIDHIKNGINNGRGGATCTGLSPNAAQMRCMQRALDRYLDGNPLNDPLLPRGPWCAKGHCKDGGFRAGRHNCGMWVNDALMECGIQGDVPNLWMEAWGNLGNQIERCDRGSF